MSYKEPKQLAARRDQIVNQLKSFTEFLQTIDKTKLTRAITSHVKVRLATIEPIYDELNNIQVKLLTSADANEYINCAAIENFDTNYFTVIGDANEIIGSSNPSNASQNNPAPQPTNEIQGVKLPTINLPTFSGAYAQWMQFRDTFKTLIHDNQGISPIMKFQYLHSSLKGDAARILENLEVSSTNYDLAWKLLHDRFENKRIIIHNHVKAIFELPSVTKESLSGLRNISDNLTKHLRSLNSLGQPTEAWDTLIIYIVTNKLDLTTKRDWEKHKIGGDVPTIDDLMIFLNEKCQLLEKIGYKTDLVKVERQASHSYLERQASHSYLATNRIACPICKNAHTVYNCEQFLRLNANDRISECKRGYLCLNCLRKGHTTKTCTLNMYCKKCNKKHHTMLHIDYNNTVSNFQGNQVNSPNTSASNIQTSATTSNSEQAPSINETTTFAHCAVNNNVVGQILLSTAIIGIRDKWGQFRNCRVILDSGSQSSFITEELTQQLGLKRDNFNSSVIGINSSISKLKYTTQVVLKSRLNEYKTCITCIILPKITEMLPVKSFNTGYLNIPHTIRLADPTFNNSGQIDVLLGATIFWDLLCTGQIRLGDNKPILHNTRFGWIVAGHLGLPQNCPTSVSNCAVTIDDTLTKFWELEEVNSQNTKYSDAEQKCEEHFLRNVDRDRTGRFIVRIPFTTEVTKLGQSRTMALNRFYAQEKKLNRNAELKQQYVKFMTEYEQLGHMSKVHENHSQPEFNFYLPHHSVIKGSSSTTKLRVVFDGSAQSDTGLSLNNVQMVGPALQNDIFSILLRFRKHNIVFVADIEKMYRQILIHKDDRKFQRIIWRSDTSQNIECYELNTITYGTASAPYLAMRCLRQLATNNEAKYPLASNIIKTDFFVDDILTGADSIENVMNIQTNISNILASAGLTLRKYSSNDIRVLNAIKDINQSTNVHVFEKENLTKTLGVMWNSSTDMFQYTIRNFNSRSQITKRTILSLTSQIFDPLGILSPIVINAKIIIQSLWQLKLSWDEAIPSYLHTKWLQLQDQLSILNSLEVPRHIMCKNPTSIELHGFCDASEKAYGACVYVKSVDNSGVHKIELLCAKSRVAPVKNVTLPRLELSGALLLANLVQRVRECTTISFSNYTYWSDSTITLAWIKAPPNRWKTFVANRVAHIQGITNRDDWQHVKSDQNPADIISRGIAPSELSKCKLWFHGPKWLADYSPTNFSDTCDIHGEIPEQRTVTTTLLSTTIDFDIFNNYESLHKLKSVFAYCLRFIGNSQRLKADRISGVITPAELDTALHTLIKIAQGDMFPQEINSLKEGRSINNKSSILSLNPILDENNILRVGGRLQNSQYNFDKKHPIIMQHNHPLTRVIFVTEHERLLHCGAQTLLASIREHYWPIHGRNLAKLIIRNCVDCFKAKPKPEQHLMGQLPAERVTPSPPFTNTGVDYAGPYMLKDRKTRNPKKVKGYICLFVCFSTKAIHLELVSDLTTNAFIAAFKRFIARRGKPKNVFSDNGTNFVGARSYLNELGKFLMSDTNQNCITNRFNQENIRWHFIPPQSPHFGGLWEAGVKSTKHHLKRTIGNASLNFEDFYTILTQIEAVLNSRPLSPLSSDPNDCTPLTPGHFLIGQPLTFIPEPTLLEIPENRLSKYQRLQQLVQHFWKRWSKEYISELQHRSKWKNNPSQQHLKPGALVIIKEDHLPPLCWQMGRIQDLIPGMDNITRTVTIRLANGSVMKRAVNKICVLPIDTSLID